MKTPIPANLFPLSYKEIISSSFPTACVSAALLNLDELTDNFPLQNRGDHSCNLLCSREQQILQSFKLEKRRREWLGGRICAKTAVSDFLAIHYGISLSKDQIIIENTQSGRPYIVSPGSVSIKGKCDISISHSSGYALALAANMTCGVDIQEPRPTLVRVRKRFCLEQEEVLLQKIMIPRDEIPSLTILWAAKEAVRKAYSLQFIPEFLHMRLDNAEWSKKGWWRFTFRHMDIEPTVICGFYQGYGIALCISGGEPHA